MARTTSPPGLRPFLPSDAHALAKLFRASIERLADDYYDHDQLDAWASVADDEEEFARRLEARLTIVALLDSQIAGFASLLNNEQFDMIYVHPNAARQGVGSSLADAIEKLAEGRGATRLSVDASDAARDFFAARGYVALQRNTISIGGEWLGNTTMTKDLAPQTSKGRA
jgi:putative acetyltransferase